MEEKKLATWGTDVPDDLVLDEKLLAEALKKVNINLSCLVFVSFFVSYCTPPGINYIFVPITLLTLIIKVTTP